LETAISPQLERLDIFISSEYCTQKVMFRRVFASESGMDKCFGVKAKACSVRDSAAFAQDSATIAGTGIPTHLATGSASVVVTTTGTGLLTAVDAGSSLIVVTIEATGKGFHFGSGAAAVSVTTSGTGLRTALTQGTSSVEVTMAGTGLGTHFSQGASALSVSIVGTGVNSSAPVIHGHRKIWRSPGYGTHRSSGFGG
jgi:hypothetical protein